MVWQRSARTLAQMLEDMGVKPKKGADGGIEIFKNPAYNITGPLPPDTAGLALRYTESVADQANWVLAASVAGCRCQLHRLAIHSIRFPQNKLT